MPFSTCSRRVLQHWCLETMQATHERAPTETLYEHTQSKHESRVVQWHWQSMSMLSRRHNTLCCPRRRGTCTTLSSRNTPMTTANRNGGTTRDTDSARTCLQSRQPRAHDADSITAPNALVQAPHQGTNRQPHSVQPHLIVPCPCPPSPWSWCEHDPAASPMRRSPRSMCARRALDTRTGPPLLLLLPEEPSESPPLLSSSPSESSVELSSNARGLT